MHEQAQTDGHETQKERLARYERLLRLNGFVAPEMDDLAEYEQLLVKARESALAAVKCYNDPSVGYRTEQLIVLMLIAWNSLLQAILTRDGIDYFKRDDEGNPIKVAGREVVLSTADLVNVMGTNKVPQAVASNIKFFVGLRNHIVHRYLPQIDTSVAGEAQAMILNFERLLIAEFGDEAALGDRFTVPLQLSEFRQTETLKKIQAGLPYEVSNYLSSQRDQLSEEILSDHRYCLRIFFVPVTANRERSADTVARFIHPDLVTPELQDLLHESSIVTKRVIRPVASAGLMRPRQVVREVKKRLLFNFTMNSHTSCWKYYEVRPPYGVSDPSATESQYCLFDSLSNGYGYTESWIDKIVTDLSDPVTYRAVVGRDPQPRRDSS